MEQATRYRDFAKECERLATQASNDHHRTILKEMAEVWKKLADAAERKSES